MDQEKLTSMIWEALQEQNDNEAYLAPLNDDCSVIEVDGVVDLGRISAAVLQSMGAEQASGDNINLLNVDSEVADQIVAMSEAIKTAIRESSATAAIDIAMIGNVAKVSIVPMWIGADLAKEGAERTVRHTVYGTVCETCEQEYRWVDGNDDRCPHCYRAELEQGLSDD
jgi:hypothetical protein